MKPILLYFLLNITFIFSQPYPKISISVDSTKVKIGQEISYQIKINLDTINEIKFNKNIFFSPFEVIEESKLDTIFKNPDYFFIKKYKLIHFDSGAYTIPKQKIKINNFDFETEPVEVFISGVEVDTLKQPMYGIKPIIDVEKNYDDLFNKFLWIFIAAIILIVIFIFRKKLKPKVKEVKKIVKPFDKALEDLKDLEKMTLNEQREYKIYYTKLTQIVRRYLEEEAKVSALESTSNELLIKLKQLKKDGTIPIDDYIIDNLKIVLEKADLVKFAKLSFNNEIAIEDRILVEKVVKNTQKIIPEPSFEEIQKTQKYVLEQISIKRKRNIKIAFISLFALILVSLGSLVLIYGYYPVRDEILFYPTKKILNNNWYKSQYGFPPIEIETPEILKRISEDKKDVRIYNFEGEWGSPFSISLKIKPPIDINENSLNSNQYKDEIIKKVLDDFLNDFQVDGAKNIFPKNEVINLNDGIEGFKIFGSADIVNSESKFTRCNFFNLIIMLNKSTIEFQMIYDKEDRYGKDIEDRLINSVKIIKEL